MSIRILIIFILFLFACDRDPVGDPNPEFTIENEKELAELFVSELEENPNTYGEFLNPEAEPFVYNYVQRVADSILSSPNILNRNTYDWEFFIVNDSFSGSAYGLPGGKIVISSGLLLYMQSESELAGLLGKEIYHIDQRQAIDRILETYGAPLVLLTFSDTAKANVPVFVGISRGSSYSNEQERDGDFASVDYLCNTSYKANGLENIYLRDFGDSASNVLTKNFLSYPLDTTRIFAVQRHALQNNCSGNNFYLSEYMAFQDSLRR